MDLVRYVLLSLALTTPLNTAKSPYVLCKLYAFPTGSTKSFADAQLLSLNGTVVFYDIRRYVASDYGARTV